VRRIVLTEGVHRGETIHRRKDGTSFPVEASTRRVDIDGKTFIQSIVRDISERKQAQARIERLNRLYAVLSETNKAIVRATEPEALLQRVCEIAVAHGDLRLAWIGFFDEKTKRPTLVVAAGEEAAFLRQFVAALDTNGPAMAGPAGRAVLEERVQVCEDYLTDPTTVALRDLAVKAGFRTGAVFPLRRVGATRGVFAVYAAEPGYFDVGMVGLFLELASDVSFALEGLEAQRRRSVAEDELQRTLHRLEEAERVAQAGSGLVEMPSGKMSWTSGAARIFGREVAEMPASWEEYASVIHSEDRARVQAAHETAFSEGRTALDHRIVRPDGEARWIRVTSEVTKEDGGSPVSALASFTDVTEQKADEERRLLWAQVLESSSDAIVVTDGERRIVRANRAFEEMTGFSEAEVIGELPGLFRSDQHDASFYAEMLGTLVKTGRWRGEVWHRRKDGSLFPALVSLTSVQRGGRTTHFVAIAADLTERKSTAERLEFLAQHDALTDLPNRALFEGLLAQAVAGARREGSELAVLCVDVDLFKTVNESLGHSAGDEVLRQVASRIRGCLRSSDVLSRPGGDEFLVLLAAHVSEEEVLSVAGRIGSAVSRPLAVAGSDVTVTASVGAALFPSHGDDAGTLLSSAETAMYQAKGLGRNTVQRFSAAETRTGIDVLATETRLVRALERDEFILHFQPVVELTTGRVTGAEALVRWNDPIHGLTGPAGFIPLAEERGLVVAIGEWVLSNACLQARRWIDEGKEPLRVSVNISAFQFRHPSFERRLSEILSETRLPPRFLELELTESVLMSESDRAVGLLRRVRDLGVALAIDDFGTGFSSLAYLRRFPIDRLKIDQSFVRDLWTDASAASIVRAVIAFARGLNVRTVAEGIETKPQLTYLRFHGCDEGQGFLLGRPAVAKEIDGLVVRTGPSQEPS
jgi:diguanylate cyclase (GGDEF)-like protein/PAS domain S-box-containing protein